MTDLELDNLCIHIIFLPLKLEGRMNMQCTHCGHQQALGHFCGMCGVQLNNFNENDQSPTPASLATENIEKNSRHSNASIHFEEFKKNFQLYVQYFIRFLKNPSAKSINNHVTLRNSLISILLFTILATLSFHKLTEKFTFVSEHTLTLSALTHIFAVVLSLQVVGILSISLINHFFGPQYSFKKLIYLYGRHLSLINILTFASFVLFFLDSFSFGGTLFFLLLLFSFFILPLYILMYLLLKKSIGLDPFYGFIVYLITFGILIMILLSFFANSFVVEYLFHFVTL